LKRLHIYIIIIIAVLVLMVLGIFGVGQSRKGVIVGTVTDALSGDPVHKAKMLVGGRSAIRYMDKNFEITNLKPGKYTLRISAPSYESVATDVSVGRGVSRVDVTMKGTEVAGLDHIIVFADSIEGQGIQLKIRFVNKEGVGIDHFPRLPMTMDAKLYSQIGTEEKYTRGRLIYSGSVDLYWDSKAYLGKNKGVIPKEKLKVDPKTDGKYGVLDMVLHSPQGDFKASRADILLE
jgi:hypothetical protein